MVSKALREPQGREPVESVEPRFSGASAGSLETRSGQTVDTAYPQLPSGFQRLGGNLRSGTGAPYWIEPGLVPPG